MKKKAKKNPEMERIEIRVRVVPRSSRNQIIGEEGDVYKIKITAPPVDGLANKALVDLFAKELGISKSSVEIISGRRSKHKTIRLYGVSEGEVISFLKGP